MSLWEKWEREKLEKQGIRVERHRDVDIRPMHEKKDMRKQAWIILGAFVACLVVVYAALTLEAVFNGRKWSDTYIVRFFAEKEAQRQSLSGER